MGRPILLVRLEGPLQSWGTRARWDVRDTSPEPTKSGVVGLLGCALGYSSGDPRLVALDKGLRFGLRVEHAGWIMEDFQTISDFLPTADGRYKHSGVAVGVSLNKLRSDSEVRPATLISPRFYLEDAAFLVALEERPSHPGLAELCAQGVQNPVWPLFLGRKACIPTRPIFDDCVQTYADLEEALWSHPWSWLGANHMDRREETGSPIRLPERLRILVEPEQEAVGITFRQDAVPTGSARLYGFRPEKGLCPRPRDAVSLGKGGTK